MPGPPKAVPHWLLQVSHLRGNEQDMSDIMLFKVPSCESSTYLALLLLLLPSAHTNSG
jgi:hypothetical protein